MPRRTKQPQKPLSLTSEQKSAVDTRDGQWAVYAGPGAGKTGVLVERFRALVRDGVNPRDILSLTFTAAAAKEMRVRADCDKLAQTSWWRPYGFLTFHSLALSFCTIEREAFDYKLAAFPLATEGQTSKLLGESSRKHNINFKLLGKNISLWKRGGVSPERAASDSENEVERLYAEAYKDFEIRRKNIGVLDFDSMMCEMTEIIGKNRDIRDRWSYQYLMGDETQDADEVQFRAMQLLTEKHGNVFCVGDPGQSVYQFRGAAPSLFLDFEQWFPKGKRLYLSENFRSTQEITEFVKEIHPFRSLGEKLHTRNEKGVRPSIVRFASQAEEAEYVVNGVKNGADKSAILARTNRLLNVFEDRLSSEGIRYHLIGKSGFWNQSEVRDVVAYVQCAVSPMDGAVVTAIRAPFYPSRYIRKKELIEALQKQKKEEEESLFGGRPMIEILGEYRCADEFQNKQIHGLHQFLLRLRHENSLPAQTAIQRILTDLRALEYYESEEEVSDADNSPKENLDEILKTASRFSSLVEFLNHVRKIQNASRAKKGVALATLHGSKGLEFDTVFLTNCSEGVLPHKRSESIDEEERLWLVGCSRAAKKLSISYSGVPSRFLQDRVRKTDGEI